MKAILVALLVLGALVGVEEAGSSGPKWLITPLRDSLASSSDEDVFLTVYKGGQAIHVQATWFAPQIELWDGAGNLIGAEYAQGSDTHAQITMPPGGTVTNILYLHVSGTGVAGYPAFYKAWKGPP